MQPYLHPHNVLPTGLPLSVGSTRPCRSSRSHICVAVLPQAKPTPSPQPARKPNACGRALGRPGKEEVGPVGAKVLRPGRGMCRPKGLRRSLMLVMLLVMMMMMMMVVVVVLLLLLLLMLMLMLMLMLRWR